ncbi:MAG: hypothetical protein ISS92_03655 [Candidatus Omnitrophica bacterium]|nr:hypothetical protein [Candidatus Omnitrophota bacterium]
MKKIIFVILILLFSVNCYAVTKEAADDIKAYLFIQGKTAEKMNKLFEDLGEESVSANFALDKVINWKIRYEGETEPPPGEVKELDRLMNDYFSLMQEYVSACKAEDERAKMPLKRKIRELYLEITREERQLKIKIGGGTGG